MAPYLSIFLLLLTVTAAKLLSVHTQANSQALIERRGAFQQPQLHQYYPSEPTTGHGTASGTDVKAGLVDDLELLDIVLLASVDGNFHAVNRTSGQTIWSMASHSSSPSSSLNTDPEQDSGSTPSSALAPLIRTTHLTHDPETTDSTTPQETYIIEPQSGNIYILTDPSSPLQRFPFSMQELVDLSPYSFDADADRRVFVGKKETALMVVELETGRIKATLSSECPWDQFEEFKNADRMKERYGEGEDEYEYEVDLDELEGSKPVTTPPTEVYIGRTDYHVTIYTEPLTSSSSSKRQQLRKIQNLSFSTYGPNKQDSRLQSLYQHTKDNAYIQSLPNGEVISFKAQTKSQSQPRTDFSTDRDGSMNSNNDGASNSHLLWGHRFTHPIVAVFDVLRRKPSSASPAHGSRPFVLLQPRPRIHDLIPDLPAGVRPNPHAAFVGIINVNTSDNKDGLGIGIGVGNRRTDAKTGGSLFAMGPDSYPLVVFGATLRNGNSAGNGDQVKYEYEYRHGDEGNGLIDGGDNSGNGSVGEEEEEEEGMTVDELTRIRKLRDERRKERQRYSSNENTCHPNILTDLRCLVGLRPVEAKEDADGHETRMKRLLDGPREEGYGPGGILTKPGLMTIDPPPSDQVSGHTEAGSGANVKIGTRQFEMIGGVREALGLLILGILSLWILNRGKWRKMVKTETQRTARGERGFENGKVKIETKVSEEDNNVVNGDGVVPVPGSSESSESRQKHGTDAISSPSLQILPSNTVSPSSSSSIPPLSPRPPPPSSTASSKDSIPLTYIPPTPSLKARGRLPTMVDEIEIDLEQEQDNEGEGDGEAEEQTREAGTDAGVAEGVLPNKRKTRRGKRGTKKGKNPSAGRPAEEVNGNAKVNVGKSKEKELTLEEPQPSPSLVITSTTKPAVSPGPSLIVSDVVLGYGSHGTVVFQGSLQGRAVAVKRLLQDFVTLAHREVSILQESDDHPNVIRYYYQEAHAGFLYIALELCPCNLADIIETPDRDAWRDIAVSFDPKRALKQITSGLRHLHGLKLIHRDIKPQNILVSVNKGGGVRGPSSSAASKYRMLISDFGLCKKLEMDQTSFAPTAHGAMAAGTVGWRAPEILKGEVKLDDVVDESSMSSRGSVATVNASTSTIGSSSGDKEKKGTRLTKSVDIFALGCLYYYTLTGGGHPFGDRYEREVNIMKNAKNLELLLKFGEEGTEAADLIEKMLDPIPSGRPDTTSCLLHPFFWDPGRRLNFLQDASDRFEIMCRDPKDPDLLHLEKGASSVVGEDWLATLDRWFIENLGKFRKYDGKSVQDLLRALRNKKNHYQDLPDRVKRHLTPMPEGFLAYFTNYFPRLFLHVHRVIRETGLMNEPIFRSYFELSES